MSDSITPIQQESLTTRILCAKDFLKENPDEKPVTAARIFQIKPTSLNSSLTRKTSGIRGGHNKILQQHHVEALHSYIRSLLAYGIQPTFPLVYNSICNLKRAQNPDFKAPSLAWFRKWYKENKLHTITSKPLAAIRLTAQDEKEVQQWFKGYRQTIQEKKIKRKNIINFDEAGFRVGCAKGQKILVPIDILEVWFLL